MFLREPLSESELNFVKSTEYFDNEQSCRTFIPELEVEIEKVEQSYSFCRCPEPKARKIVRYRAYLKYPL